MERGNLSSPTHDPELHFGPKLRLGRQDLSEKSRALAWDRQKSSDLKCSHTCHHHQITEQSLQILKVLKSGPWP